MLLPGSAVPLKLSPLFSVITGAFGATWSPPVTAVGADSLPAASVAVASASFPSATGFGAIVHLPLPSVTAVPSTAPLSLSVTVMLLPGSAVPLKLSPLFSVTTGTSGAT